MGYQALYRKFRPGDFEDVKGQEHIVTTLKNQIKANRIGHAYLFCGTRGTGKTTIAKILAKAVNCENPIDGGPCNQCKMCKSIQNQTSMNVIEIDAASNNGVDNVREIIEEVQYSPTEGKYKVYIIDEVHMLSTGAFNALLKTLEEPPSYVMFILATTEAHKIPITILSRCQRYDFKRISIDTIAGRLAQLMEAEGIEAEEKALRYVAKAADGSMRDGLSLLDQCIAFYFGETLTYEKVLDVLGAVDIEIFQKMFLRITSNDAAGCIALVEELVTAGRELGQFLMDFTWHLRNLLLIKTSEQAMDMIDVSAEQADMMREEAEQTDVETLLRDIRILSEVSNQIKYSTQKRVLVEVAFIKLCKPQMETDYSSLVQRLKNIETQLEKGIITAAPQQKPEHDSRETEPKQETEKLPVMEEAIPEDLKQVAANWPQILNALSGAVPQMLTGAKPTVGEGGTLLIVFQDETCKRYFDKEEHLQALSDTIEKYVQKKVTIRLRCISQGKEEYDAIPDISKWTNMPVEYED